MRRILIVSALLLVSLSPTLADQSGQSVDERRSVPGVAVVMPESPVQLSEPSYTLERSRKAPDKLQIDSGVVTVTNTSGRDIRRLSLIFTYKLGASYGGLQNRSAVNQLRAGETRAVQDKTTIRNFAEGMDWTLTVTPTGAEFADDTYWAAPRDKQRPLLMQYLSQPGSYLQVREFQWVNQGYQATLQVGNAKVVAYRLGIVKDTAENFEVRIGNWIELNDEQTNHRAMFTDESNSLNAEQIFSREAYTWHDVQGKAIIERGGVAIFVAELKFADGRTWQQDTTREALLWDN
jgi:hypothetical protein